MTVTNAERPSAILTRVQRKGRSRHALPAWVFRRLKASKKLPEAGSQIANSVPGTRCFALFDLIHLEMSPGRDEFDTFEEALTEIVQRAQRPWDQYPNRAPCREWAACGREYVIREYAAGQNSWTVVRAVPVASVSADGVTWSAGFESVGRPS